MTVQTLVKVQDQLREEVKVVNKNYLQVKKLKLQELEDFSNQYFEEVLDDNDEIKVTSEKLEFTRPQEGYNYNKELVSLRFHTDWKTDIVDRIDTDFYSTSENSQYELRRMIVIGKVGQILLDFYDDILGGWNQVNEKYSKQLESINEERFKLEKEIKDISDQIADINKQQLISKVQSEGIEFEVPEGESVNGLPNLDVKLNTTIYNIKGIQIVSKSASGKSADIQVKILNNIWNYDTKSYEEKEEIRIVTKVRMNNILQFLQYNSDRISAS